ncbi:L,D-transpeptidase family protein [Pseudohoeflea coraliihabitans]|uniref:L,D-transpeptidase family protein n=1 Tax=Pseudohoeflea coraliihabitans TaxID=2860393 RepID=UPI003D1817D7
MHLPLLGLLGLLLLALTGCQDALDSVANKAEHPLPSKLVNKMKAHDMSSRSPIMMRIFKEEGVLEIWKQKGNGRFDKLTEYEICKWSGKLGPKFKEGDRQAPEGYYRIYPAQMNPRSSYYLSFNLGFPNGYDRAHGRTGTNLMVHGACSSAGCYSMTDEQVLEIYGLARDAFKGGQEYFTVAAYPFRMTPENMARHRNSEHFEFWKMLKIGYDQFELTKRPPQVEVCEKRYVFNQQPEDADASFVATAACPAMRTPDSLAIAYQAYQHKWNDAFSKAVTRESRDEAREAAEEARRDERDARMEARQEIRSETAANGTPLPIGNLFSTLGPSDSPAAAPAPSSVAAAASSSAATAVNPAAPSLSADAAVAAVAETAPPAAQPDTAADRPFWKIWGGN